MDYCCSLSAAIPECKRDPWIDQKFDVAVSTLSIFWGHDSLTIVLCA